MMEVQCPACDHEGIEMSEKTGVAVCPTCSVRIILNRGDQLSPALWLKEMQEKLIPSRISDVVSREAEQAAEALGQVPDLRTIWLWRGLVAYLGAAAYRSSDHNLVTRKLSEAAHCLESADCSVDKAAATLAQSFSTANCVAREEWLDWARNIIEIGGGISTFGLESLRKTVDTWYEIVLLMILEVDPRLDLEVALGVIPGGVSLCLNGIGRGGYVSLGNPLPFSQLAPAKHYWRRIALRVPSAKRSLVMACVEMSDRYATEDISIAPEFLELALEIDPWATPQVVGTPPDHGYSGYWRLVFVAIHQRDIDLARRFFQRILELDRDLTLSARYFLKDVLDIPEFGIACHLGVVLYASRANRAFSDKRVGDALAAVEQILKLLTIELRPSMRFPLTDDVELLEDLGNRHFRLDLPDDINEYAVSLKNLLILCSQEMVGRGDFNRAADYLTFAEYMRGRAGQRWDFEEQIRLASVYAKANRSYDWLLKRAMLVAPERKVEIEKAARSAGISWLMFQWCWLTRQSEARRHLGTS